MLSNNKNTNTICKKRKHVTFEIDAKKKQKHEYAHDHNSFNDTNNKKDKYLPFEELRYNDDVHEFALKNKFTLKTNAEHIKYNDNTPGSNDRLIEMTEAFLRLEQLKMTNNVKIMTLNNDT
tara:strand:+ start:2551 stop:2913 length:363 start_codon:yes stop_codon:yes gene_type:complete